MNSMNGKPPHLFLSTTSSVRDVVTGCFVLSETFLTSVAAENRLRFHLVKVSADALQSPSCTPFYTFAVCFYLSNNESINARL